MAKTDKEKSITYGQARKARLYNAYIDRVTLGDIIDFLEEFSFNGDPALKDMIQINFNIQ